MFYHLQNNQNKDKYKRLLNGAASFGILNNPNSKIPIIDWRQAERIFCTSFNATDVASKDISIDAYKMDNGIGIKTFQGGRLQKIAEFNNRSKYLFPKTKNIQQLAKIVSTYRNERLINDIKAYDLKKMFYHFTFRKNDASINIIEQEMKEINIDNISLFEPKKEHIIKFSDGDNFYSFNTTKSTLYMNFDLSSPSDSFLYNFSRQDINYMIDNLFIPSSPKPVDKLRLSLFSERSGKVEERSGLNQWNALGRVRHHDEVYIPIPARVHREFPNFFPSRDTLFSLKTLDGKSYLSKICQSGGKALMSNPNRELGKWILRDRLKLNPGTVVTRKILEQNDSLYVDIIKYDNENFEIQFI